MFDSLMQGDWTSVASFLLASIFIVLVALPVHELSHALLAYRLGDPTAKNLGRLTFNPLSHIDPAGTLLIVLFGFGWAKPVPINMNNFRNPRRDMAISALAGPVSNVLMAFLVLTLYIIIGHVVYPGPGYIPSSLATFFNFAIMINLYLAAFNLIPFPPLDGSHILKAFLPTRLYYKFTQYEQYSFIIVMLLLFTGILSIPLRFISNGLFYIISLPFQFLGFQFVF